MRVIVVPVADRPECAVALEHAFELADVLGGNVVGTHIRPHRDSSLAVGAMERYVTTSAEAWDLDLPEREIARRSAGASGLLADMAQAHGFEQVRTLRFDAQRLATWQERVGSPDRLMPIVGAACDLLVVSRAKKRGKIARLFMLEAVLHTGRPALVVPQKRTKGLGSKVLIGWNQSNVAMQAVISALPILRQAQSVKVAVVGSEDSSGPKASQLVGYLKVWGVRAQVVRARGQDVTHRLLDLYRTTESNLLVVGAYSRSRLREMIFGGLTEYLLNEADIPVLMHHGDR